MLCILYCFQERTKNWFAYSTVTVTQWSLTSNGMIPITQSCQLLVMHSDQPMNAGEGAVTQTQCVHAHPVLRRNLMKQDKNMCACTTGVLRL